MYSQKIKTVAIFLFLLSGTISTFAYKLQGTQIITEGTHQKHFFHPYMQSFTMFIGEGLCLLIYLFSSKTSQKDQIEEGKKPYKPYIFLIPAVADSCSSILQYMGLSIISGSTYMMFKGASIVTTAIFSKVLINMQLEKRHFVGCGLAILGIVIVGSSGFLESDASGDSTFDKEFFGYVLMLISLIFNGFFYAYEQYLLKKHSINPLQMVGFEGVFGMGIVGAVVLVLSFIPCPFSENACVYNSENDAFIEIPWVFFEQLFDDYLLLILVVGGLLSIGVYNLNGLRITKMFDALTRSLLNVTKTSLIWVVGIIITLIGKGNPELKLQSLKVSVNLVKAVGFGVIILGTLIYNRLILKQYFSVKAQDQKFKNNFSSLSSGQNSSILSETLLDKENNRIQ